MVLGWPFPARSLRRCPVCAGCFFWVWAFRKVVWSTGRCRKPPRLPEGFLKECSSQGMKTESQCCRSCGWQIWGGNSSPPLGLQGLALLCGGCKGLGLLPHPRCLLAEPPALGPSLGWGRGTGKNVTETPPTSRGPESEPPVWGRNSSLPSECAQPNRRHPLPLGSPNLMETMYPLVNFLSEGELQLLLLGSP